MRKTQKELFICDKCGKEITYNKAAENYEDVIRENQCHTFNMKEVPGYGSKFDSTFLEIDVCDDCLWEIIKSFKNRDKIAEDVDFNRVS